MHKIQAENYPIHIDTTVFDQINEFLNQVEFQDSKFFIFVDENTNEHCLPSLIWHIDKLQAAEIIETESGEENKTLETTYQLWNVLTELEADRNSVAINLCGGMLSDMAGFVSSTFKRGIRFINIPTTLLSMVDASIGGKLGIDMEGLKNQIGLFNNPEAIFINTDYLKTLDSRQLKAGMAEIIKHGLIADANYLDEIYQSANFSTADIIIDENIWPQIISKSLTLKNTIVSQDFHEKGIRKTLNFGHTVGHAIESWFLKHLPKQALLHGEAVAMGMIAELYLSHKELNYPKQELEKHISPISALFPKRKIPVESFTEILNLMHHDKKNSKGDINFVLISKTGQAKFNTHCSEEQIIESLNYLNTIIKNI
ncbi:MAG: 3-dehydroquinate synthase [Bacteroidales bacterium]|nr:3-dehydroquinate synthase [Bacteroidales bacterium]